MLTRIHGISVRQMELFFGRHIIDTCVCRKLPGATSHSRLRLNTLPLHDGKPRQWWRTNRPQYLAGVGPDETIQISPEPETMSPALDRKKVEVNELIRMLTDVLKSTSDESPQLKAWQTLLVALHPQIDASRSLGGRKSGSLPAPFPGKTRLS